MKVDSKADIESSKAVSRILWRLILGSLIGVLLAKVLPISRISQWLGISVVSFIFYAIVMGLLVYIAVRVTPGNSDVSDSKDTPET